MVVVETAEIIRVPFRPVYLVKIDIIRLQAFQAGVNGLLHVFFIQPVGSITHILDMVCSRAHLGGDDQVLPVPALFQPATQVFFRPALGLDPYRAGIEFRGVNEINAFAHGIIKLLTGFRQRILFSPGHAAQADQADADISLSQFPVLHVVESMERCITNSRSP